MQIVSVRGMKANASGIIYCGRPCRGWKGSPLCNPSRDWGCPEYNAYLREQVRIGNRAILDALLALPADAKLGCWCTNREGPAPDGEEVCHCEIIAKVAVEVQARGGLGEDAGNRGGVIVRTLAELLTLVKSDPGSLTPGELKFIRAELAKLDESKEPEKPGRLIPQSRDPLAQVLEWILAGAGERDLREAIAATFPDQNGNALILSALRGLEKSAEVWSAQAMGFCYEASRELYRRMVEIGDFPGALRAVKMIADLSKIGRNGMDRLADDIEDMLTVKASEVK